MLRTDSGASPSFPLSLSMVVVFLVGPVYKQKWAALLFGVAVK